VPVVQRAVLLFTPFSIGQPDWHVEPLASAPVVALLQAAVLVGFFVLSLVAGHRLSVRTYPDPRRASRALIPFAALAFAFAAAGFLADAFVDLDAFAAVTTARARLDWLMGASQAGRGASSSSS